MHKYGNFFSAIGQDNRDIRNLIVLDIDVNCDTDVNKAEVNRILIGVCKMWCITDFIIKNHETHHIQMQWLVKDVVYKVMDQNIVLKILSRNQQKDAIKEDINKKRKEIISLEPILWNLQNGVDLSKIFYALTCIRKRINLDKNIDSGKQKTMSLQDLVYNLELMMPYYRMVK